MLLLLVPWIVLWSGLAVSPVIGGAAGIAAAALLPLLWLRFRPVVFERISVPVVAGISLAALLGVRAGVLVPAGQILFGLLWLAGAFPRIPLTAHYSAKGYGGDSAFNNPLFLRTNRILTAAWGVLNLLTGCLPSIGAAGPITTILLGIFTVWFQKWYPARWARGTVH